MKTQETLYQKIINDIREKISTNILRPGDHLYSLKGICEIYRVSKMTAVRVIDELKNEGLVQTIYGKGSYISEHSLNAQDYPKAAPVRQIVILRESSWAVKSDFFPEKISQGIYAFADENRLGFRKEFWGTDVGDNGHLSSLQFRPGDGAIIHTSHSVIPMLAYLRKRHIKTVIIDTIADGCDSVLTDNYDGIFQITRHLQSLGHRRLAYVGYLSSEMGILGILNHQERMEAFALAIKVNKLDGKIIKAENYNTLREVFKSSWKPTAVMFPQDDPALHFINILKNENLQVPRNVSVTGFDDYACREKGLEELTTFRVNCQELGRKAGQILIGSNTRPEWHRIKGELIIRKTVSRPGSECHR